jgi:hypothetical protein
MRSGTTVVRMRASRSAKPETSRETSREISILFVANLGSLRSVASAAWCRRIVQSESFPPDASFFQSIPEGIGAGVPQHAVYTHKYSIQTWHDAPGGTSSVRTVRLYGSYGTYSAACRNPSRILHKQSVRISLDVFSAPSSRGTAIRFVSLATENGLSPHRPSLGTTSVMRDWDSISSPDNHHRFHTASSLGCCACGSFYSCLLVVLLLVLSLLVLLGRKHTKKPLAGYFTNHIASGVPLYERTKRRNIPRPETTARHGGE